MFSKSVRAQIAPKKATQPRWPWLIPVDAVLFLIAGRHSSLEERFVESKWEPFSHAQKGIF